MNSISLCGIKYSVGLNTTTGMISKFINVKTGDVGMFGGSVYYIHDYDEHNGKTTMVLVATDSEGKSLESTYMLIDCKEILDLLENHKKTKHFHYTIMEMLGFKEECSLGNDLADFLDDVWSGEYFVNDNGKYEMI